MSRRDEDDDGSKSGGRTGRIRKKSAKVLEMEEFEEIEKKQFTKKDGKGKTATTPPGIGAKKPKGKGLGEELVTPSVALATGEALPAGITLPVASVVQEPAPVDSVIVSPVKASTKQAIGAKVREGQGSVIKLLLSSPAIPTTPTVTTNVITKTPPLVSVSSLMTSITSAPAPTSKKGMAKIKSEPPIKQEPEMMVTQEDLAISVPIKSEELMDPEAADLMLETPLAQEAVSPPQAVTKADPGGVSSEGLGSLKLKLMMSPKDTPTLESIVPTSGPIPNLFATNRDETDGASKNTAGSGTTKKKAAPKKKKAAGEKAAKQPPSKSAAEQMPNLAALVSTPKLQKTMKEDRNLSLSDGMDTSLSDTSLDMSSIVESALDMEEEAALVIAEGAAGPDKPKKKRASGGSKKKAKVLPPVAMELPGFESGRVLLDDGRTIYKLTYWS